MKKSFVYCLPILALLASAFHHQPRRRTVSRMGMDTVVNYMNTDTILWYGNLPYKLAWSSHPASTYYMQEYISKGETVDHYNNMLFFDFLQVDTPAAAIVDLKINELLERKKKNDMYVDYKLLKNNATGEYLLQFTISDGNFVKLNIVEYDVYRYMNYTDKKGHKGVLLFALSKRAYGDDITPFFPKLERDRAAILKTHAEYPIPAIEIK